ncbi:molybdopterin-dependent oxidoreductase [Cytobacillus sp. Hz8]|uniref:molybdopterin-dependent oxidoreductase n=1 Tax=Cytobacillus sp. Hz8 TaxID=3347168 RepID=UPI0035DBD801
MEKESTNIFQRKLDRRKFLKGSAATAVVVGAGIALPGGAMKTLIPVEAKAATKAAKGERVVNNICQGSCYGHCPMHAIVRDGKLVRTRAINLKKTEVADYSRICSKGTSWPQYVYAHSRIKHPYKRVGKRGSGKWEQISWDEAIKTVTENFKKVQAQYGKSSVTMCYEGGILAPSLLGPYTRMMNLIEASHFTRTDDFAFTAYCMNLVTGASYAYGNDFRSQDVRGAKNIVLMGVNVPETAPQSYQFIADAVDNGAKLIVIDPNFNTIAAKAKVYAPIRPATDGVLCMAMINYIEQHKLTNETYLRKWTVAPFLVKEKDGLYLRKSDLTGKGAGTPEDDFVVWDSNKGKYGYSKEVANPEIRGTYEIKGMKVNTAYRLLLNRIEPFTVKRASKICDLPASVIEEIAQACAQNPTEIIPGVSIDHYRGGYGTVMALGALQMVTGNLPFTTNLASVSVGWPVAGFYPEEQKHPVSTKEVTPFMLKDLVEKGKHELEGGHVVEMPIKAIALFGGNPAASLPDHQNTIAALKKADFVVSSSIEWDDKSIYSDIVLPASTQFEQDGLLDTSIYLLYAEKAIEPLFDSKPDWQIAKLIAEGMGQEKYFENFDGQTALDMAIKASPAAQGMGITLDKVKQAGIIQFPSVRANQFFTVTGRAQFYDENPKPNKDFGQKIDVEKLRLPYFDVPFEAWTETIDEYKKNPLADKYPLVYITGSRRFRTHAAFGYQKVLRELESEPRVRINPKDAKARGIKEGDLVKLYNDRGHVVARAIFHPGIRPGVVDMDRGWQTDQYVSGHYNNLTHLKFDPGTVNDCFYDVLCEMEKA